MAYTKTVWKDRVVQNPRTYTKTDNADGSITLTPKPGVITEEGTPISASNMNKIENAVESIDEQLGETVTQLNEINSKLNSLTGTYTDTTTIVPALTSYTKTIPLGFNATKGQIMLRGSALPAASTSGGSLVKFTTVANDAMSIGTSGVFTKSYDGFVTPKQFANSGYIALNDCYINGTNLVLVFYNNHTTLEQTLKVISSQWEVFS